MAYNGKLNWIEVRLNNKKFKERWNGKTSNDNKWKGYVKYSAKNKADGKWHLYKKTKQQLSAGSDNTVQAYKNELSCYYYVYRKYGKKITSGTYKGKQKYREYTYYLFSGFLTSLTDAVASKMGINKYSRVFVCEGVSHSWTAGKGTIPRPTSFEIEWKDVDARKVTVNGKTSIEEGFTYSGVNRYIVRHKQRTKVLTSIGWSYLTQSQANKVLSMLTLSSYIKVNMYDAKENANKSYVMVNNSRTMRALPMGAYGDFVAELEQA